MSAASHRSTPCEVETLLAQSTSITCCHQPPSIQRLWSSGYDSRLGLSKDIKCERSQVRVLATASSFAFLDIWCVCWRVGRAFSCWVSRLLRGRSPETNSAIRLVSRTVGASIGPRGLVWKDRTVLQMPHVSGDIVGVVKTMGCQTN